MSTTPIHVLSVGPFGRAVARHLAALRGDCVETPVEGSPVQGARDWPKGRMTIVAAWRPVNGLCRALDRMSHERRLPFVPLVADSMTLRVGPVVIPGRGSCWTCWHVRYRQHARALHHRQAVWQHYETYPEVGPSGYLEPYALLGAARLCDVVDAVDAGDATRVVAGTAWQIDMLTREITTSTSVGVDACPQCGLQRGPDRRTVADMQSALGYLWRA
jgi:bacteriocin biosynthesis cyclodehydratase domain-containing protein